MCSLFAEMIILSASIFAAHPAQAQKQGHGYTQARIVHLQPAKDHAQSSQDDFEKIENDNLGDLLASQKADLAHSEEDALTKKIEQDNTRLERLIDIIRGSIV
jgi:hypothetical protein